MRSSASWTRATATSPGSSLPPFYGRRTRAEPQLEIVCASASLSLVLGGQPMRLKMLVLSLVAALSVAGAAEAGYGNGCFLYTFVGQLTTTPSNGGVSINVDGGNRAALR